MSALSSAQFLWLEAFDQSCVSLCNTSESTGNSLMEAEALKRSLGCQLALFLCQWRCGELLP